MSGQSSAVRNRGLPAAGPEVFRLTTPVVLWWIWVAFAAANVIDLAVQGSSVHSGLVIGAILLVITGFAYALALRPRVVADQAGITVVNPFRDHHVPWAVIQGVDTGDWVKRAPHQGRLAGDRHRRAEQGHRVLGAVRLGAGQAAGRGGQVRVAIRRLRRLRLLRWVRPAATRTRGCRPRRSTSSPCRPPRPSPRAWTPGPTKERARLRQASPAPLDAVQAKPGPTFAVTARWAWFPFAAIAVPALALLIVALLA